MGTGNRGTTGAHDVLEALPDGVVVADDAGVVSFLNEAARRLLRVGDGVGKPLAGVVSRQDRAGNSWYGCADPYSGLSTCNRLGDHPCLLSDPTGLLPA